MMEIVVFFVSTCPKETIDIDELLSLMNMSDLNVDAYSKNIKKIMTALFLDKKWLLERVNYTMVPSQISRGHV